MTAVNATSPLNAFNPYIDPKGYETELAIEEGAFKLIIENQKKAEAAARPGASN